jgi:hypothetical protein
MNLREEINKLQPPIDISRFSVKYACYGLAKLHCMETFEKYIAELVKSMEELKHKECLKMKASCLVNDTISQCQELIKESQNERIN